jgi:serpin B
MALDPPETPSPSSQAAISSAQPLVQGNTAFALRLYKAIGGQGNLFLSPQGASEALAICFEGARGKTAAQMAEVLGFPDGGRNLEKSYATLRAAIAGLDSETVEFRSANSLWSQLPLESDYIDSMKRDFGADLFSVRFGTPEARDQIFNWVEKQTDGKVKVPEEAISDPLLRVLVINTLFFKAPWAEQFSKRFTQELPFELSDGRTVEVPTMVKDGVFGFGRWDDLQILELPYHGGGASAFVLLPAAAQPAHGDESEGGALERMVASLDASSLQQRLNALSSEKLSVYLPRFSIRSELDLAGLLQSLGMSLPFSLDADFSGMTTYDDLHIDKVLQDAWIDLDESGTEAAAVTSVSMNTRGAPRSPGKLPNVFRADRPFMFLIRENSTGSILFMGRVSEPSTGEDEVE